MIKIKTVQKLIAMILSVIMLVGTIPITAKAQQFEPQQTLTWNDTEPVSLMVQDDLLGSGAVAKFVLTNLAAGAVGYVGGMGMEAAIGSIFGTPEDTTLIDGFNQINGQIQGLRDDIARLSAKLDMLSLKDDLNAYGLYMSNYAIVYDILCKAQKNYANRPELTDIYLQRLYHMQDANTMVEGKSVINATIALGNRLTFAYTGNYNIFGAFDKMEKFTNRWEHQGYVQRQAFRDSAIYTYAMFSSMSQLACQAVIAANPGTDYNSEVLRSDANGWLELLKQNAVKVNDMNERCAIMEHPQLRIYRDTNKGLDLWVFKTQVEQGFVYNKTHPEWTKLTKDYKAFTSKEFLFPMLRTTAPNREDFASSFALYAQQPSVNMYQRIYNDYKSDNGGKEILLYNIFFGENNGKFDLPPYKSGNALFTTHTFTSKPKFIPLTATVQSTWTTNTMTDKAEVQDLKVASAMFQLDGTTVSIDNPSPETFYSPIYYYGAVQQGKLMLPDEPFSSDPHDKISGMASYYTLPHTDKVILTVDEKIGSTYQWHVNHGDGNGFQEIESATSTSYTLPALAADMNGYQYICTFIEESGTGEKFGDISESWETVETGEITESGDVGEVEESGEVEEVEESGKSEEPTESEGTTTTTPDMESFGITDGFDVLSPTDLLVEPLSTAAVTLHLNGEGVPVQETVHEVGSAEDMENAMETVSSGQWDGHTLRLTSAIEYTYPITLLDRSLSIDLNGYALNIRPTATATPNVDPMSSTPGIAAIYVGNNHTLTIINRDNGALNVVADHGVAYGVYATEGGIAQVSTVVSSSGSSAIYASGNTSVIDVAGSLQANGDQSVGARCVDGAIIRIGGDITVTGSASFGAYVDSSNGNDTDITIDGSITVTGVDSRGAYLDSTKTKLTVKGNLTVIDGIIGVSAGQGELQIDGNITASGNAVNARDGALVHVGGNILSTGKESVAVSSFGASVQICGDVSAIGSGSTAIAAAAWEISDLNVGTQITVDGKITAVTPLRIEGVPKNEDEHVDSPTKPGYYAFTDGRSTVWAKSGSFVAPTRYTLTVNGNGGTASGSGQYANSTKVSISAGSRSGYYFNGWRSNNGGSFADQSSSNTTFSMPAGNVTVTASWASTGGSGSGSASDAYTPPVVTIPIEKKPDQPVTAVAFVTTKKGLKGSASTTIPKKTIADAIAKAQAAAKTKEKTANGIGISLTLNNPVNTKSLAIVLTQTVLKQLNDAKVYQFEVNGQLLTLNFNQAFLQEIQRQSSGNVTITVKPTTVKSVRNAYNITISYIKGGKTVNITSLDRGSVIVSIPCTPGKKESTGYLYGVYVNDKGKINRIPGSTYDANSKSVIFTTNHFSIYGVGYTAPSTKFTDISTHWSKESIDYVVGRGLLFGTSNTIFDPNTAMTRGILVMALGRLANVNTKLYTTSSFTDVKADSAFLPYIEWAYKKGIIQGIGNSQFDSNGVITREEIALILANYAKTTGYTLPITREAAAYSDASNIDSAYKTAITAMQQAGIMMGGSDNKFNPKSSATRAEVSAMLHRYIKLTINPSTAQSWVKNDDGKYLYYKDGLMVSGKWLQIDEKWYYFTADGSLAKSTQIGDYEVDENGVRKTK